MRRPIRPGFYSRAKFILVRGGSGVFCSEFGKKRVVRGDAILMASNTLCGSTPDGSTTYTTVYLDPEYLIDQVRWRHAHLLHDKLEATRLLEDLYPISTIFFRLDQNRAKVIAAWLDELVVLSRGSVGRNFHRMQALWSSTANLISPFLPDFPSEVEPFDLESIFSPNRWAFPMRAEARLAAELLRSEPGKSWTLACLSAAVHLSSSQLRVVFTEAHGKTPAAYLAVIRAERLAELLRTSDLTIDSAMLTVGWRSSSHGTALFRRIAGMTPGEYRRRHRRPG
ncbi:AraC family transcriptional regulator [Leucobacter chromiireducens subsp. solipictus]|uniref:AraC family transcriptional regulator n=2 Tax=Leucobacter TaxID=55968 RepID=A0ABS1SEA9_9MICO|nr:AraC family transcriptional regulator [Leucobacter chromiireducens subsp. solipictus]